jgi:Acetyl-CoA hydrolase/transferase C-terminal domain
MAMKALKNGSAKEVVALNEGEGSSNLSGGRDLEEARSSNRLVVTLTGAVASVGLDDGRVLSGVGGQYNFVAMAHALEDGRSILMIRSTKEHHRSNFGGATATSPFPATYVTWW